ncbi:MAG: hypothetical protein U0746_19705 [Gemmataceae bacterium]
MPTKDEVARRLAQIHYDVEDGITQIVRYTNSPRAEAKPAEPIKLLEVNRHTIPAGVMPLWFAALPSRGIAYPSVIVEVTPEEYRRIQDRTLKLPAGWKTPMPLPKGPPAGD